MRPQYVQNQWFDVRWQPWSRCGLGPSSHQTCADVARWTPSARNGSWFGEGCLSSVEESIADAERFAQENNRRPRILIDGPIDVFDEDMSHGARGQLLDLITGSPDLTWLIATRHADRITDLSPGGGLPENLWIGSQISNQEEADQSLPCLAKVKASVKFALLSPLVGQVDLNGTEAGDILCRCEGCMEMTRESRLDWVIVGGEQGADARPTHPDWIRSLRNDCRSNGVPFYFQGWGEWGTGSILMGSGQPVFRTFSSYADWVNKASTRVRGGVCLDTRGRILKNGADMMRSRDEDCFPVTIMDRVGWADSGRVLDGATHEEAPRNEQEILAES